MIECDSTQCRRTAVCCTVRQRPFHKCLFTTLFSSNTEEQLFVSFNFGDNSAAAAACHQEIASKSDITVGKSSSSSSSFSSS